MLCRSLPLQRGLRKRSIVYLPYFYVHMPEVWSGSTRSSEVNRRLRMANKYLFASSSGRLAPPTDTVNEAGGKAYSLDPKTALAQYACTGCFSNTYYADASIQFGETLALCERIPDSQYLAKLAVYSRERAFMKDMPAFLLAYLSRRNPALHERVFNKVINNTKMLRTYCQIMRSGITGRKSFGSGPKRLIREWLASRNSEYLFESSVGQNPSLMDIIRMVHPKPADDVRSTFYSYMLGKPHEVGKLPQNVRAYEDFRRGLGDIPDLPFMMLSHLPLKPEHWKQLARSSSWQTLRMNLNTFHRHGVLDDPEMADLIASRLKNQYEISKARVFPYQLLAAYINFHGDRKIQLALQDALDFATTNIPEVPGHVVVCPDVSGSMSSPITGYGQGHASKVRCVDVAALIAAAIVKKNPLAHMLAFSDDVRFIEGFNPYDSVITNAQRLARCNGGGTDCSSCLRFLNDNRLGADLVIYVSDNQSWLDYSYPYSRVTGLMKEWSILKSHNPLAKMICLDLTPYKTTQAPDDPDILNIGGFSDSVFEVISMFANDELKGQHWVNLIEEVRI